MDIGDYEIQTRNALMGEFMNGFEYELKESNDRDDKSLQLVWKKVVEKDQIKVSIFSLLNLQLLLFRHCFVLLSFFLFLHL